MREAGIPSQRELAKRSGLDPGTLANITSGRVTGYPSRATLQKLAKGLSTPGLTLTADDLFKVGEGSEPATVSKENGELRQVIEGLRKRYDPTEEEWAIIDELDRTGSWYGGFSQPGFWELTPEERETEFFYLKGLMREHRKREQGK